MQTVPGWLGYDQKNIYGRHSNANEFFTISIRTGWSNDKNNYMTKLEKTHSPITLLNIIFSVPTSLIFRDIDTLSYEPHSPLNRTEPRYLPNQILVLYYISSQEVLLISV